jgi:hypothetical protein
MADDERQVINSRTRTTDLIAQPLIVENQLANRIRQQFALPTELESSSALGLAFGRRRNAHIRPNRLAGAEERMRSTRQRSCRRSERVPGDTAPELRICGWPLRTERAHRTSPYERR